MLLNNGSQIDVLGQVNVESKLHLISKLSTPTYINGMLVKYIILPPSEFKEFRDKIAAESAELTNIPKEDIQPTEPTITP